MIPKADWYQGSILREWEDLEPILTEFAQANDLFATRDGSGMHSYTNRRDYLDAHGKAHLQVQWGGVNKGVNVRGSGSMAEPTLAFMRYLGPHKVSRMDAAYDVSEEGAWDRLYALALAIAEEHGLYHKLISHPANPELGATFYVGSKKSGLMLRIYQKGWQMLKEGQCTRDEVDPNWVRVEFEAHPVTRDKARFSKIAVDEVAGYARWARIFLDQAFELDLKPVKRIPAEKNDFVRTTAYVANNYQNTLMEFGMFRAIMSGSEAPTNSEAIDHVLKFIRSILSAAHPDHRQFMPGWQVLAKAKSALEFNKQQEFVTRTTANARAKELADLKARDDARALATRKDRT